MVKKIIIAFLFLCLSITAKAQIISAVFQFPNGDTICVNTEALFVISGSSGDSIVITWGDGQDTTLFAPYQRTKHLYTSTGTYTVTFTAHQGASTVSTTLVVTVVNPPNVDFSYSFSDTCATQNLQVQFTDLSDPGLTNYQWNFGDGTTAGTSTQTNPSYTYATPANYIVSLTAQNHICPNRAIKILKLPYDTTLVTAISDSADCPCNVINFSAAGNAVNWHWDFGDGNTANTQNTQHTYAIPGTYLVTVRGINPVSGCEYSIGKTIEVCGNDINVFPTRANENWYFFQNAGVTFSGGAPAFAAGGQVSSGIMAGEGGATVSDPVTGALLFYTDGQKVWDRNHVQMPNGFGMFGNNSATESALIVPKPGNANQYYIFTSSGQSSGHMGCYYSIVDLTLNASNGDVINKNTPLYNPQSSPGVGSYKSEVLKGVVKREAEYCNNAEYWVIIPANQDTFNVYPVSTGGVGAAVVNNMINPTVPAMMNRAVMASAMSHNGKKYAIIEGTSASIANNRIRVMDFNSATGVLSNQQFYLPYINYLYGVVFSPDDSKLYGGGDGFIIQYDLLKNNDATIFPVNGYVRIMQTAPDGKIYFITEESGWLGRIDFPNVAGTACGVNQNGVFLNGAKTKQGLQNFVPLRFTVHDTIQASFSVNTGTICSLDISVNNLSATLPPPDSCSFYSNDTITYLWDFGDGTTSTLFQPGNHSYASAGSYSVKLVVKRNRTCTADSLTQLIHVAAPPPTHTITIAPACDSVLYNSNWYFTSQTIADTLIGAASNGCDSIINAVITVNNSAASAISPTSCGNYLSPAGNVYTISGLYSDTLLSVSGCDSIISINLTVIDSVVTNTTASACDSIQINSNWYFASQLVNDTLTGAAANGCDSIVRTNLTITFSSTTTNSVTVCQGQTALIHGINQTTAGVYTQTFFAANGCDSTSTVTLAVDPMAVSSVTLTGCDSIFYDGVWLLSSQTINDTLLGAGANGCDSISNVSVSISTTPVLVVSPIADSVYAGNSIILNASGAAAYLWDDGSTSSSITITPSQNTTYCVIGTNDNCPDTVCAEIYVVECVSGKLFVPNAFSPNGDGENDKLCVYGTACIKTMQLNIYNRWGELVFQTNSPSDCWDGTFRNKNLDTAVFTFSLEAISTDNENITLSGNITLVR